MLVHSVEYDGVVYWMATPQSRPFISDDGTVAWETFSAERFFTESEAVARAEELEEHARVMYFPVADLLRAVWCLRALLCDGDVEFTVGEINFP